MAKGYTSLNVLIGADTRQLNKKLTATDRRLMEFRRTVSGVAAGMGVAFGASSVIQGIGNAISKIADFEAQMSKVKAVTGATSEQFEKLNKNAIDMGSATKFTATQVAQLQTEYGKLGFSTEEIINATEATLDLAAATDAGLAESAKIAGTTLRAFNLDASEMQRVTDVMAKSFSTSALDLEKFGNSMEYVAPIAKAAGVSVEFTTAMLAKLADAGISGSKAGTGLRRILNAMAETGKPTAQAFAEVASKGIDLESAMDEVGRTAQTALTVLNASKDKVYELDGAFVAAEGSAKAMAATVTDNLTGDLDRLSSAIEKVILGGSKITDVIRLPLQLLTESVNKIGDSEGVVDGTLQTLKELIFTINPILAGYSAQKKKTDDLTEAEKKLNNERAKAIASGNYDWIPEQNEKDLKALAEAEQIKQDAAMKRAEEQKKAYDELIKQQREWAAETVKIERELARELEGRNVAFVDPDESGLLESTTKALKEMADAADPNNEKAEVDTSGADADKEANDAAAKARQQYADTVLNTSLQIGDALAMESDQRKKAIQQIIKANAAAIISDLIRSAVAEIPFPMNIAAAGAAGIAGGALIGSIPEFAEGGIISGKTIGVMGEYAGAKNNPEVVAPLDKLRGMIDGRGQNVTVNLSGHIVGTPAELGKKISIALKEYGKLN